VAAEILTRVGTGVPEADTRLSFGTPAPPTVPYARGGPATTRGTSLDLQNRFTPLGEQGSISGGQNSEALISDILREGLAPSSSSTRGSKGRYPIPLTPEILHLLGRLEPDKGTQARLLKEHLTRQRTLPSTEHELQTQLERKAAQRNQKAEGGSRSGCQQRNKRPRQSGA
jgi:hypothetical protein